MAFKVIAVVEAYTTLVVGVAVPNVNCPVVPEPKAKSWLAAVLLVVLALTEDNPVYLFEDKPLKKYSWL
jgi:hypothetical protein